LRTIAVEDDRQTYGDFYDNGYWSGTEWKGHKNLPSGYWVYMAPQWYIFAGAADVSAAPTKPVAQRRPASDGGGFGNETPQSAKPASAAKPAPTADAKAKPKSSPTLHGGEKAILAALNRKATLDFTETPLRDVSDYLMAKYRIPIRLDTSGLKDAGVDPETPVTCHLTGISLQSALEIVLEELQLKWTIHHDVLMFTSPQKAESDEFMYTKVYDVADLVIPDQDQSHRGNPLSTRDALHLDTAARGEVVQPPFLGGGLGGQNQKPFVMSPIPVVGMGSMPSPTIAANIGVPMRSIPSSFIQSEEANGADFKPLMDTIENTIATKSWIDNGGNATMSEVPCGLLLAISQTREVHSQIEQFLADLRAGRRQGLAFHIELHWLWLDAAHRDALFSREGKRLTGDISRAIDPEKLRQVAREVPSFHAVTNCLNGESGTIVVGDRRALIVDAIPVTDGGIAYQPVVSMPNIGVTANVRPILLTGAKSARVTVSSNITRWTSNRGPATVGAAWGPGKRSKTDSLTSPVNSTTPAAFAQPVMGGMGMGGMGAGGSSMGGGFMQIPAENPNTMPAAALHAVGGAGGGLPQTSSGTAQSATTTKSQTTVTSHGPGSASCPIDLPVMPTQEFGTTLRVPLGKPVVVGSVTFAPAGEAGVGAAKQDAMEVYLIATTSVVKELKKKSTSKRLPAAKPRSGSTP
jgi:hypothetical protein